MADNETKIKDGTAKESAGKGGRPFRGHHGRGKYGHRPRRPAEKPEAGAETAVAEQTGEHGKPARKAEGARAPHKEEHKAKGDKPHKGDHKPARKSESAKPHHKEEQKPRADKPQPKGEGKDNRQSRGRRDERRREERESKPRQGEERNSVSPRAALLQERQSAEQRAFDEASDILLEAAKRREAGEVVPEDDCPRVEIVGVRFKPSGKIYYFAPAGISFDADDGVIVETARGQEYGFVALSNRMVKVKDTVQPLKEVIRKATDADKAKHEQNKQLEKRAVKVWEELVKKHALVMSLTDVEYTFDNAKLTFYFTADGRVDFRELVKDLAGVFRTRIELRQIGVRDEAKLMGGLGVCGMPFCCHRFLPDFVQVSIKMAKEQNLSLSSSKISGNCGRLMCCLRYEQDVYDEEYLTFPRADMVVRTAQGTGVIAESNFLSGKIKVRMDGEGTAVFKTFTRDEVKVIGKAKRFDNEPIDKELKALED
ncbi:MAG: hypothetical protein IKK83_04630 [Clostridia bacterium]|nr:hypothetical protein [Clostridia bacterium]